MRFRFVAEGERNNKYFISDGSTRILAGDKLYVMADDLKSMEKLSVRIGKPDEIKKPLHRSS